MSKQLPQRTENRKLGMESLESRRMQAQFGIPWADSTHLTMSYAPDGTTAYGESSELFAVLDTQMPRTVWQGAIQRAMTQWTNIANINVGVVADGGQSFGTAGPVQGDRRFGDIRLGGFRMDPTSLAVSVPPSAALNGTLSGDIFININETFDENRLYQVALHEFGHAFGLPHSTVPRSVMFSHLNQNMTLAGADVAAIRSLYGARSIDLNEIRIGNDTIPNATRIKYSQSSGGYTGSTPVIAFGDLSRVGDRDVFEVKGLDGYTGAITFRVQTQSISLVSPEISLFTETGQLIAKRSAPTNDAGVVSYRLATSNPNAKYYLQVTAKTTANVSIGRYGVGVVFEGLLQPTAITLDTVMRGTYENLAPEKVDLLFKNPNAVLVEDDLGVNDTTLGAVALRVGPGQPNEKSLKAQGSLNSATDVDFYRVDAPKSGGPWVLTTSLTGGLTQAVLPKVELFNGNMVQMPVDILVNDAGRYAIQATNLPSNGAYFLRVYSPQAKTGNYGLNVNFGTVPADLTTMASGQIASAIAPASYNLYIAKTQLFNFVMDATGVSGTVTMRIRNDAGQVVLTQTVAANATASAFSTLLPPGRYTVRISATGPLGYRVRGLQITDPIGPIVQSATLTPQYQSPTTPGVYNYPNGTTSSIPFNWVLLV